MKKQISNIVSKISKCPIIASGGAGSHKHIGRVLKETRCSAVAVADLLHIQNQSIDKIKKKLRLK